MSHNDLVIILLIRQVGVSCKIVSSKKKLCSVIVNTPDFQDGENIPAAHCNNVCIGFGLLVTS